MANLTITAANVVKVAGAQVDTGIAGATITAGQSVYKDAANNNVIKLADGDASAAAAAGVGVALNGAASGQPVSFITAGGLTIGTGTVGTVYIVSATAGAICPIADAVTGMWVTILGVVTSSGVLTLNVFASGAQVP